MRVLFSTIKSTIFPKKIVIQLKNTFGNEFDRLPELERLILSSAATEQVVTHRRMTEISTDHTRDLTLAFQRLMKDRLLVSDGHGRGIVYHLPGQSLPSADQIFSESSVMSLATIGASDISWVHNGNSLAHNERHDLGCLMVKELAKNQAEALSNSWSQ